MFSNVFNHWSRWHPEVALRYLPIVTEIQKTADNPRVLDVGSAGLGIAPYLRRSVTGVDIHFEPPFHPLLKRVEGSALDIPFGDQSFDIVISADTLEHMSPKERIKAIKEMIRVAEKKVIIAVPSGEAAFAQDQQLDEEYYRLHQKRYHFLEEQIGYGLPEEKEIRDAIAEAGRSLKKELQMRVMGNESLALRQFLMRGWMSDNLLTNILHRKIFLLLLPLFTRTNAEPTYRKIFIISLQQL